MLMKRPFFSFCFVFSLYFGLITSPVCLYAEDKELFDPTPDEVQEIDEGAREVLEEQSGEYAHFVQELADKIADTLDFNRGRGIGELITLLVQVSQILGAESNEEAEDLNASNPIQLSKLRAFLKKSSENGLITVPVNIHQSTIDYANMRLKRAGFDFVKIVPGSEAATLPDPFLPLPQHEARFKRNTAVRLFVSSLVGFTGSVAGSGMTVPNIAAGSTVAAWEIQFAWLNNWWSDKFGKWKTKLFLGINAVVASSIALVVSVVEKSSGLPVSFNPAELLIKTGVISTLVFYVSFGKTQIAAPDMLHKSMFSGLQRLLFENYSSFWNNFGRIIAITAVAQQTVLWELPVGPLGNVRIGTGDFIGWGFQLAYMAAVTIPILYTLSKGEEIQDETIKYNLEGGRANPNHSWNQPGVWGSIKRCAISFSNKVSNFYTPRRQ